MQLTSSNGLTIGKVIFQKDSHAEQPSTSAASYRDGEIDCNPVRNTIICMPLAQVLFMTA